MEMDMKVIEQLVAQALKEMKAEEPAAFVKPKEETYGVFATMDEAIVSYRITCNNGNQRTLINS